MLRNVQSEAMGPCGFIRPIPACWDHLTRCCAAPRLPRCSASLRLPPSLPLMSPYGLPSAGYPASPRWHVFATVASLLRLPTLGYTVDSPLISCAFAAVNSARETHHGLPGLAVKNETDASSLVEVCFLIATFVQRMRPRAQL